MTTQPKAITEKDDVHKAWFEEAKKVTFDTLPAFMKRVMDDYEHDYGTVCHAIAACSLAAAWAANDMKGARGGITGFQSGFVMWGFVQHWLMIKGPMKLVKFEEMLFPQYEDQFDKTISKDTMKWLVEQAKEKLAGDNEFMHADVLEHLKGVAKGLVPFGYRVVK